MKELELRMKVVTPLFMGGADNTQAELRPSSIKGLLRFWWRAIQPPEVINSVAVKEQANKAKGAKDIPEIVKKESKIFGGAGKDQGQSRVHIRIVKLQDPSIEAYRGKREQVGITYLGYGVANSQSNRKAIMPGYEFEVQISLRDLTPSEEEEVMDALWCMTHLGGMGSRSRRGFGSVVATRDIYKSKDELVQAIKVKLDRIRQRSQDQGGLPDYTAITKNTRVYILGPENSWEKALDKVGVLLSQYRLGTRGQLAQIRRPQDFITETQEVKALASRGECPQKPPPRAVFGLPHNYFFISTRQNVQTEAELQGTKITRRASPLFIHIHQLASNQYVPVVSFIPAKFLPKDSQLVLESKSNGKRCKLRLEDPPYEHIEDFLRKMPNSEVVL